MVEEMTLRLFIDPGVEHLAGAWFQGPTLWQVGFYPREAMLAGSYFNLHGLVIEKPTVYPGSSEKDPNDLIDLAGAAYFAEGAIRARGGPPAHYVKPFDWKGQLKKPQHHARIWSVLANDEREAFGRDAGHSIDFVEKKIDRACELLAQTGKVKNYSWAAHNLLDAVGLGLWYLGRTGRAGHRYPSHEPQVKL
jgi:hypothetical protein